MIKVIIQHDKEMEQILRKRVFVDGDLRRLRIDGCSIYEIETKLNDNMALNLDDPSTTITVKSSDCRYRDVKYYTVAHMEKVHEVRKQEAERVLNKLKGL